jgi:hypothetical protein
MWEPIVEDTVTAPVRPVGERAWKRMARRIGTRRLPIGDGTAWAVATLVRAAVVIAILACAGEGRASADAPPSSGPRFDANALDRMEIEQGGGAARRRTVAEVVAQITAKIGPPTLVDPARAATHESTWAIAADGACAALRVYQEGAAAVVTRETFERGGSAVDYGACADAAVGRSRGRRFAEAATDLFDHPAPTEDAARARLAPSLGKPTVRGANGARVRLVWAERTAARCAYVIVTFGAGAVEVHGGAPDAGMPWNVACGDWSAGKPTSLWTEHIGSAALYRALTADDQPARVDAARELLQDALDAARTLGATARRAEMVRRLGPPRVVIAGAAGWAVEDGNHCASVWWRAEDDPDAAQADGATPGEWGPWLRCASIARRDRRLAAVTNVGPWVEARAGSPREQRARLIAVLGKPAVETTEQTAWAAPAMDGSMCVSVELQVLEGKAMILTRVFDPAAPGLADCKAMATR